MDKVRIRIVKGTYGYNSGTIVSPKKKGDIIDVTAAKAKRLVEIGVAEVVGNVGVSDTQDGFAVLPTDDKPKDNDNSVVGGGENEDDNTEDALEISEEGLNKLTVPKLAEFAEDLEIDTSKFKRKSDYVTAILAAVDDGAIVEVEPPVIPE